MVKVICRSKGLGEKIEERRSGLKYLDGSFVLWEEINSKNKETIFEKIKRIFKRMWNNIKNS